MRRDGMVCDGMGEWVGGFPHKLQVALCVFFSVCLTFALWFLLRTLSSLIIGRELSSVS